MHDTPYKQHSVQYNTLKMFRMRQEMKELCELTHIAYRTEANDFVFCPTKRLNLVFHIKMRIEMSAKETKKRFDDTTLTSIPKQQTYCPLDSWISLRVNWKRDLSVADKNIVRHSRQWFFSLFIFIFLIFFAFLLFHIWHGDDLRIL